MKLWEVYKKMYKKEVFKLSDVLNLVKDYQIAKNTVLAMKKKGYINSIKSGLYYIIPVEAGKGFLPDKFLAASALESEGYISHHSALELHGISNTKLNRVYISTSKNKPNFEFRGIHYIFIKTKYLFGSELIHYGNSQLSVSDIEKTFLDCIRNVKFSVSVEEILKSIMGYPSFNYKKMGDYLERFNEKSLFQKTGFMLTLLKDELNVPESFLEELKKRKSRKIYYLNKMLKSRKNKEWNLMVPAQIEGMIKVA